MNDEQQFWRDVQKFMNQFPGFVSIAKKIGEIGDLETWQASEQRKLEAITQEIEKQRAIITSEREAANAEATRKLQDLEAKVKEHSNRMQADKESAVTSSNIIIQDAKSEASRLVGEAKAAAKELVDVTEPKKAALETEIAALMDKMLSVKSAHEEAARAFTQAKDEHARFISRIVGTAGG